MQPRITATVVHRTAATSDIVILDFNVEDTSYTYTAGQYITVFFDDTDVAQGKAYSLSSSPHDGHLSITVKKIGLFSGKLHALRVGDQFAISTPYGFFNAKNNKPVIAIAAGVGIAPIWSIIRYAYAQDGYHQPTRLLYSNASHDDIVFRTKIDELAAHNASFQRTFFVTRQPHQNDTSRRIDLALDLTPEVMTADTYCFYVCGSADFVRSMWRQLTQLGVGERNISTETFFEAA